MFRVLPACVNNDHIPPLALIFKSITSPTLPIIFFKSLIGSASDSLGCDSERSHFVAETKLCDCVGCLLYLGKDCGDLSLCIYVLIRFIVATDQLLRAIQTSIISRNQYAPVKFQRSMSLLLFCNYTDYTENFKDKVSYTESNDSFLRILF